MLTHEEALAKATKENEEYAAGLNKRWYPKFHIAAPAGWINDPNGLSHFDGKYQVFFQHYPAEAIWGPMHWGHVTSTDLVHWQREPIALAPSIDADRDGVFSGSAVVHEGKLEAFYTGNKWRNGQNDEDGVVQVQCQATSSDGVHFEKKGVVVDVPENALDFRDPKVWHQEDSWWMIFGVQTLEHRGQVWLYRSKDMNDWKFDRVVYEDPDPNVFMIECPDMFELDGRWVLTYGPMGKIPTGYENRNTHNHGYVIGDWAPGGDFIATTEYRPMDWGANFYAAQSFLTPDNRRIVYGWMGSFGIPVASKEDHWAGQLSVPLEAHVSGDELILFPIPEFNELRGEKVLDGSLALNANEPKQLLDDVEAIDLEIELTEMGAERLTLLLGNEGSSAAISVDTLSGRVAVDRRSTCGDEGYRACDIPCDVNGLKLRILIDRGSVEVFVEDGRRTVSSLVFIDGARSLRIVSESGATKLNVKAWELDSIGLD